MSQKNTNNKDISRKDAIKKMGTYATFAALGTMVMLNPLKAAQTSPPPGPPGQNFGGSNIRGVRRNRNKK